MYILCILRLFRVGAFSNSRLQSTLKKYGVWMDVWMDVGVFGWMDLRHKSQNKISQISLNLRQNSCTRKFIHIGNIYNNRYTYVYYCIPVQWDITHIDKNFELKVDFLTYVFRKLKG
jgi:hypothetical protein